VSVYKPGGIADAGSWDKDVRHQTYNEVTKLLRRKVTWKGKPQWVIAPYSKRMQSSLCIPSNAGTEQTGVNLRGPPRKPKYSLATDSEPVP
jgi:hypothetical protein